MPRPILESAQVYGGSPYCNPADHPAEQEQDERYYCPFCTIEEVREDGEPCPSCEMELAEWKGAIQ